MLETAIDYVHTREEVEEEHASEAHRALEKAAEREKALEAAAKEVHHDAEDADDILETYERGMYPEDREERREMAVADVAHNVENYVASRLEETREAEQRAKEEEENAHLVAEELKRDEENLKASLNALQALKREKEKEQK